MRRKTQPAYEDVMKLESHEMSTYSYRNLIDNVHKGCYVEAASSQQAGIVESIIRNRLGIPVCLKVRYGEDASVDYISVDRVSFWEPYSYCVPDETYCDYFEESFEKFLYITPYLPEAERIKNNCPQADFVEPSDRLPEYFFSKAMHTLGLIRQGRNITSTHQCLMYYTPETIQLLKENGYCIIIDEEVTVLQADKQIAYSDIQLAIDAGYVYEAAPDEYRRTDKPYEGGVFSHMFRLMASRPLVYNKSKQNGNVWYWLFSKELLEAVEDVFVLTYLFKNSEMDLFMQINNIPYVNIGIRRTEGGGYIFSDKPEYVPDYVYRLKDSY